MRSGGDSTFLYSRSPIRLCVLLLAGQENVKLTLKNHTQQRSFKPLLALRLQAATTTLHITGAPDLRNGGQFMDIIQIDFEVPADIRAGLTSGDLSHFGSVIRDANGIVAHLKEAQLPLEKINPAVAPIDSQDALIERIVDGMKDNKVLILAGLGLIAAGGVAYWVASKSKQKPKQEVFDVVENYNDALGVYLDAIQTGNLTSTAVDNLILGLDELKKNSDDGTVTIDFSDEESVSLLDLVLDYTKQLADANSVELGELEPSENMPVKKSIDDLRRYIEEQKRIIDEAGN